MYIINIFQSNEMAIALQRSGLEREESNLPKEVAEVFHNKFIEAGGLLMKNYIQNFSLEYLFMSGDQNPRHNPASMGQFYWISLLLFGFGWKSLVNQNKNVLILLIAWILITPIASSLVGGAHALRSSFMLPPLLILSAAGVSEVLKTRFFFLGLKRYLILVGLLLLIIQFVFFLERIYFVSPGIYADFWSYSTKVASEFASSSKNSFDTVILSNDIPNMEFAYPAYNKLDPNLVMEQNKTKSMLEGYEFFRYDNVYIGSLPRSEIAGFLKKLPDKVLYIGPADDNNDPEVMRLSKGFPSMNQLIIIEK